MKIFVCEFITSGGFIDEILPDKLSKEGDLMLQSVVGDLRQINKHHITISRDFRLDKTINVDELIIINKNDDPYQIWEDCFKESDACLIIAPETDTILYHLHQIADDNDCLILGCDLESIKLASSKIQCLERLRTYGLLTPATNKLTNNECASFPFVIKSDDGVGCENCFLIETKTQLEQVLNSNADVNMWIQQAYIEGKHASVSVLVYDGQYKVLSVNEQNIEVSENQFTLNSITVNQFYDLTEQIDGEVEKIVSAVPGLSGIIGVDFMISNDQIYILEINPRLTTAYSGLSQSIDINPMEYLLDSYNNNELNKIDIKLLGTPVITI